jgi:hypothetical protein
MCYAAVLSNRVCGLQIDVNWMSASVFFLDLDSKQRLLRIIEQL